MQRFVKEFMRHNDRVMRAHARGEPAFNPIQHGLYHRYTERGVKMRYNGRVNFDAEWHVSLYRALDHAAAFHSTQTKPHWLREARKWREAARRCAPSHTARRETMFCGYGC